MEEFIDYAMLADDNALENQAMYESRMYGRVNKSSKSLMEIEAEFASRVKAENENEDGDEK